MLTGKQDKEIWELFHKVRYSSLFSYDARLFISTVDKLIIKYFSGDSVDDTNYESLYKKLITQR